MSRIIQCDRCEVTNQQKYIFTAGGSGEVKLVMALKDDPEIRLLLHSGGDYCQSCLLQVTANAIREMLK